MIDKIKAKAKDLYERIDDATYEYRTHILIAAAVILYLL